MNTTFDQATFDAMLDDIEKYLGYLKGNELVFQYFNDVKQKIDSRNLPSQTVEGDYTTPCPDAVFRFQPRYAVPIREGASTQIDGEIEAKIIAGADIAWKNGPVWAEGIAGQARAITEQITSPDVAELKAAVETLRTEVMLPLQLLIDSNADIPAEYRIPLPDGENSVDGDWANLSGLVNTWHGTAADEFRTLYDKLGDNISVYAYFAAMAALEVGAATAIIDNAQRGLQISIKDIRTTLKTQLEKWCVIKHPPSDGVKLPLWILEFLPITKIFKGVKFIVKGITDPKKVRKLLKDMGSTLVDMVIPKPPEGEEEPFNAVYADEALKRITTVLRESYLDGFVAALSDLSAAPNSSLDFLHTLQDSGKWAPPRVSEGGVHASSDSYPA